MSGADHIIGNIDGQQLAALGLSAIAAGFDLRTRRIPNALTFGGAGLALASAPFFHGLAGFVTSAEGWLAGCVLFLPFFLLGGMGAGDVKLLAAIGAWLGPGPTLWAGLYAMLAGGAMAIVLATATGYLATALRNVGALLMHWWISGIRPLPSLTLGQGSGPRLPYAVPIVIGTAAAIWWR